MVILHKIYGYSERMKLIRSKGLQKKSSAILENLRDKDYQFT